MMVSTLGKGGRVESAGDASYGFLMIDSGTISGNAKLPEKALRTSSLQLNQSALRTAVAHSMNNLWKVVAISGDAWSVDRWKKKLDKH